MTPSGQCLLNQINVMNGRVDFSSTWFALKSKPGVALQGLAALYAY